MTRPHPFFEQPDRSKGYQEAETHGTRSATSAARFASVLGNQSCARATESVPFRMDKGRSQTFHSPFETVNEEIIECDQRSQAEKILHAISVFCAAVVVSGLLTLIVVNLFAPGPALSHGCEYDLGEPDLSPLPDAEVGIFPRPCR